MEVQLLPILKTLIANTILFAQHIVDRGSFLPMTFTVKNVIAVNRSA